MLLFMIICFLLKKEALCRNVNVLAAGYHKTGKQTYRLQVDVHDQKDEDSSSLSSFIQFRE